MILVCFMQVYTIFKDQATIALRSSVTTDSLTVMIMNKDNEFPTCGRFELHGWPVVSNGKFQF